MDVKTDKLSIIVVSFNEGPNIARLKASFDRLSLPGEIFLETILVDGGSRDNTVVEARRCGFTKIVELTGASIPVCRNAGLRASTGNWVAFVDADCELDPSWLKAGMPFLSQYPNCILGWPVIPPRPGTWVQRTWHVHWSNKNPSFATVLGQKVVTHEAFRLITTRNLLMNRGAADILEGFDENLTTGEDTDFVFRAYNRDLPVFGLPALKVIHHGEPENLAAFFRQQLWHANRKSYSTIMKESSGGSGGNAPKFTILFLLSLLLLPIGLYAGWWARNWWWALLGLPLLGILAGPAALISFRARKPLAIPALTILYAAYGLARSIDLLGLNREKKSWKAEKGLGG